MKAKVLKQYRDKITKKVHLPDTEVSLSKERFDEIQPGGWVAAVEAESDEPNPKEEATAKKENKAGGKRKTKELKEGATTTK